MTSITGDSSGIFINNGDLRISQGNVYAKSVVVSNDTLSFASNISIQQSGSAIAIGNQAGNGTQQDGTVAIGAAAGYENQQENAIAIGFNAGDTSQGVNSVAIGVATGSISQGNYSVAIGSGAGYENQGQHCVAIGRGAGDTDQHPNTVVLNATGSALNTGTSNAFYVAPVRSSTASPVTFLGYTSNHEVIQSPAITWDLSNVNVDSLNASNVFTHELTYESNISIKGSGSTFVSSFRQATSGPKTLTWDPVTTEVTCTDNLTLNTLTLNNIYVLNHAYDIQLQQLTVGNALVSVGADNVTGVDSGIIISNLLDGANVATFFRSLDATYHIGYVSDPTNTTSNLHLVTDRNLPVHVYGSVTASNGFVGTSGGAQFAGTSGNLVVGTNGFVGVNAAPNGAQVVIQGSTPANPVLRVIGAASQTGNLQSWCTDSSTIVASVSNVGCFRGSCLSRGVPVTVSSSTYTVQPTDSWLLTNTTGTVTLTLPSAAAYPGRELMIRRLQTSSVANQVLSSASNVIRMEFSVNPAVAQTVILDNTFDKNNSPPNLPVIFWCTLVSDGTNWIQMSGM